MPMYVTPGSTHASRALQCRWESSGMLKCRFITVKLVNLAWLLIWRFLANANQRQIKYRIKICLHKDGVVLTAPDAKLNTGKILF